MNVSNLLRESTKEGMVGSEGVFIGEIVERMESMLNQNDMSINQKRSLRMTLAKSFGILLHRQTDHFITARRPDIIFIDKEHHECQIIDFAIPKDTRVDDKEVEKIETYLNLARELKKVWNIKVTVLPLVVGALWLLSPAKALEKKN